MIALFGGGGVFGLIINPSSVRPGPKCTYQYQYLQCWFSSLIFEGQMSSVGEIVLNNFWGNDPTFYYLANH